MTIALTVFFLLPLLFFLFFVKENIYVWLKRYNQAIIAASLVCAGVFWAITLTVSPQLDFFLFLSIIVFFVSLTSTVTLSVSKAYECKNRFLPMIYCFVPYAVLVLVLAVFEFLVAPTL